MTSYEISFPQNILDNAKNRPLLGVSKDNQDFIIQGGYPEKLTDYIHLGVDFEKFKPVQKTKNLDKFVVGLYSESLVRGGYDVAIEAFGRLFADNHDVCLLVKDRNGSSIFRKYVEQRKNYYNIDLVYINEHWADISQIREFFERVDCVLHLNFCSTFNLPVLECLSLCVPTITIDYCGPRDYCFNNYNSLLVNWKREYVEEELNNLLSIGCRNYFFPSGYKTKPTWARPDIYSIMRQILRVKENKDGIVQNIREQGRKTAEKFTWESSARQLSEKLDKWF